MSMLVKAQWKLSHYLEKKREKWPEFSFRRAMIKFMLDGFASSNPISTKHLLGDKPLYLLRFDMNSSIVVVAKKRGAMSLY